jgi:hypothetical protein
MKIRILTKKKEMNILQIYAHETGCGNEQKEESEEISEDNTNGKYICIMGDFNAQIGKDNRNGYETITEPHREGNRNSDRENFLDMCNRSEWVIGNNWFQKKEAIRQHVTPGTAMLEP